MEYLVPILKYLSWPFMILISYLAVLRVLGYHEKQVGREENETEK